MNNNTYFLMKKLMTNAIGYGIGMGLTKIGTILVLPIYWHYLTSTDFGLIAVFQGLVLMIDMLFDLGFSSTVQAQYFQWQEADRNHHISTIWKFNWIASSLITLPFLILSYVLLPKIFVHIENHLIFPIAVITGYFSNISTYAIVLMRCQQQINPHSWLTVGQFVLQTALTLFLLHFVEASALNFIIAQLVTVFLIGIISLLYMFYYFNKPLVFSTAKSFWQKSWPLLPANIFDGLSGTIDRFVLESFGKLDAVGIYSLSKQLGQGYNFFQKILRTSWLPIVYDLGAQNNDHAKKQISMLGVYYCFALTFPALVLSLFLPEILSIFAKEEYLKVLKYVPLFIFGFYLLGVSNALGRGLEISNKFQKSWISFAINAACQILFLAYLFPKHSVWGAVIAFVISNLISESYLIYLSFKYYPRPFYMGRMLGIFLFYGFTYLSIQAIEMIVFKILWLMSCYLLMLYLLIGPQKMTVLINTIKNRFK